MNDPCEECIVGPVCTQNSKFMGMSIKLDCPFLLQYLLNFILSISFKNTGTIDRFEKNE